MSVGSNSDANAGTAVRADARLDAAIADFFLAEDGRLDDRARAALQATVRALVEGVEADLRRHAARLLAAGGHADAAAAMLREQDTALRVLDTAGLLRDPDLMGELIARTRCELIAGALPVIATEPDRPSLLARLADQADTVVASAARAVLAVEGRRDRATAMLPAEHQHRLVWWTAAAIRERASLTAETDQALAAAAQRCLASHDEGERAEAVAERLAAALDPLPAEVPVLLMEALADRRVTLVIALLARAVGIDGDAARALVVEPDDDRLWAALRLVGLSREEMARVALSLAEADHRRDIESFADRLDTVMAITPAAARAAIASLSLPRDFRVAARALSRGRR